MTIYLDHNATTPLRPEVWDAMASVEFGSELRGNPSSVHRVGVAALRAVAGARHTVASILGARDKEIVFTGGGSEAINLALRGAVEASGSPAPISSPPPWSTMRFSTPSRPSTRGAAATPSARSIAPAG